MAILVWVKSSGSDDITLEPVRRWNKNTKIFKTKMQGKVTTPPM